MQDSEVIVRESVGMGSSAHSMLGVRALFQEMEEQGVEAASLLLSTGLVPSQVDDPKTRLSLQQKITIFRNVWRRTRHTDVGLRAGVRQRLSDFGVYGYALVSSNTFGEGVLLGFKHLRLIGPVVEKRFYIDGSTAVFSAHDVLSLGELLPMALEFWFASAHRLATCTLEAPMPSVRLLLPYPKPPHWKKYETLFNCPVEFNADVMEWHFDASVLSQPCPNANPITADICQDFCGRMVKSLDDESALPQSIRIACLNSRGAIPNADVMAARLGMSVRTLHRRLVDLNMSYQEIVDDVRKSLAAEYLLNTEMTVEEIASRVGFSEPTNFRRAFRKWTGSTPAAYRAESLKPEK